MARACLTYLCFDYFENGPDFVSFRKWRDDKWRNRRESYNFGLYAAVHWGSYTRGLGEEDPPVQEQLFRFLISPSKCTSILQMRYYGYYGSGLDFLNLRYEPPHCLLQGQPWLHIAAGARLASICRMVMEKDETKATPPMQTSVDRARHKEIRELKETLKATMKRNMLISAVDHLGNMPLHEAAGKGFREVVILLLENGADVNARGEIGSTALHLAAVNGFSCVVSTLLDNDADMTVEDASGHTPLAYAMPDEMIAAFLDKIAKTSPWMLEELSSYTLPEIRSENQIPQTLRSSFGRDLSRMLSRLSRVPSRDSKYEEPSSHWRSLPSVSSLSTLWSLEQTNLSTTVSFVMVATLILSSDIATNAQYVTILTFAVIATSAHLATSIFQNQIIIFYKFPATDGHNRYSCGILSRNMIFTRFNQMTSTKHQLRINDLRGGVAFDYPAVCIFMIGCSWIVRQYIRKKVEETTRCGGWDSESPLFRLANGQ
jgi:Ankyrin repeats (3 copies)